MVSAAPNRPKARRLITAVLYIAALMLMLQSPSAVDAQEKARPEFVFGYSIKTLPDVDISDATAALNIYLKKLSSRLQISAESVIYQDKESMLKDILEGRADLFSFSAMEYLRMEAKIRTVRGKTGIISIRDGKTADRLLLLVHKGAPVATLGDLSGRKVALLKGDDIALLFLNLLLLREGQPEMPGFFSEVDAKSNASQALLSVFFGQADACIVKESAFRTAGELNPQVSERLRILAESPAFIATVAFFRKGTDEELLRKVIRLSGTLAEDPQGRQILTLFKVDNLGPFNESDLDNLRAMLEEYDRLRTRKLPSPRSSAARAAKES